MQVPAVRAKAHIQGRDGEFLIIHVDAERQLADLIPVEGPQVPEENVPFAALRLIGEAAAMPAPRAGMHPPITPHFQVSSEI